MAGRDSSHQFPGRGLPPYLLWRSNTDSSTDSDGESRIFAAPSRSTTSDKDTVPSSISRVPRTFSSISTWSRVTDYDMTSISVAPSAFGYETSNATRSFDNETGTSRSASRSIDKKIQSSSKDTLYTGPVCLTKSNDHNVSFASAYDVAGNVFTDPEYMFTPYVRIFSDDEQEQHTDKSPGQLN